MDSYRFYLWLKTSCRTDVASERDAQRRKQDWITSHGKPVYTFKVFNVSVLQEAFVLLDLLGAEEPRFRNYFDETTHLYEQFMSIGMHQKVTFKSIILYLVEQRLDKIKHLESHSNPYFPSKVLAYSGIEDDHIPFHRKGM